VGDTPDRQAIEAVIRSFLDAAAQGKFPPDYWTGPVADVFGLGTEVGEISPIPLNLARGSVRVQKLEVQRVQGDAASAVLRADCYAIVNASGTERPVRRRYTGGVVLRRVGGEWRLVTLRQDGVDVASSLFEPTRALDHADGAEVEVAARYFKKTWVGLIVVRNVGDEVAVLGRATAEGRVWGFFTDGGVVRRAPLVLRPGARWGIAWTSKPGPFRRTQTIRARINDKEVAFALRPPDRPVWHRVRDSMHPNTVVHLLVLLTLVTVPFAERGTAALGISLLAAGLFNFGSELLGYLRGGRYSAQFLYGAVGLVEVALGVYLMRREQVGLFGLITSLAVAGPLLWLKVQMHLQGWRADRAEIVRDATAELDGA